MHAQEDRHPRDTKVRHKTGTRMCRVFMLAWAWRKKIGVPEAQFIDVTLDFAHGKCGLGRLAPPRGHIYTYRSTAVLLLYVEVGGSGKHHA